MKKTQLLKFVLPLVLTASAVLSGCRGSHEKHTGGDDKHLYPSDKAKESEKQESIPTPGGSSGGTAGSQSSSEKKSNPTNPDEPASR